MRVARQFRNLLAACFAFVLPWSSLANPPTHAIILSGDVAPGQGIVAFRDSNSQGALFAGSPDGLQFIGTGDFYDKAMLDNSGNVAFLGSRAGSSGVWFGPPSNPRLMTTTSINAPHLSKNGH